MTHAERAGDFLRDPERARWHDASLWSLREKRDRAATAVPDWEALREAAAAIKRHTLASLPFYLARFEERARARGAVVHWARDAAEHNAIVEGLLREAGATRVVKSKSMLTEECGLNPWLEARGIELVDTDLGERIVQLRCERPSHIVMPAIHLRRAEIGALFHAELGTPEGLDDPARLTLAARTDLRRRFLGAQAGITGVNFAIAETGGIVVCTNEGNADLGTALPPLHIACMGIEKLIPRAADLPVFLRLLARSATGQAQTAYTSHLHGPRPGGALHIVLVDNGRSALRSRADFADALACIRCGACMNTCPVFRRSGGHSYDAVIPGPIGSVLEPARAPSAHASLPQACTLCGSCRDVCPVRIDLPKQLLAWRGELLVHTPHAGARRTALRAARFAFEHARVYAALGALARLLARVLPERWLSGRWNAWTRGGRALPRIPRRSFRAELARRRR
ncbi:MAG TPA: lactate utilization protein B [Myxococcota bacterium]|nr:lactate utilization protein B [Myxococcota bacterium]